MKPTPEELLTEIQTGPLAASLAPLVASGQDNAVANLLNSTATGRTKPMPITVGDFANFLGFRGLLRKINDARTHADESVASGALLLMWKIQGQPGGVVDPNDPTMSGNNGLFAAFLVAGIVTQADIDAFGVYCSRPCSRAAELGWDAVSADDVALAYGRG